MKAALEATARTARRDRPVRQERAARQAAKGSRAFRYGTVGPAGAEGQRGAEGPPGPEGGSHGEWTALALGSKVKQVPGFESAAVRAEGAGSSARLRGVLEVTNEIKAGETVFTVPAGYRAKSKIEFGVGVSTGFGSNHAGSVLISTDGVVTDPETPVPPGIYYLLDGLTWNLN